MYAPKFQIRCSAISQIMASMKEPGLSDKEKAELADLELCAESKLLTATGKVAAFTPNRKERLAELIDQRDHPKDPELPAGAKTYCENWLTAKIYDRFKDFTSKSTEKGIRQEDEAIELLSKYESDPFMVKHEGRKSDGYIQGECDVLAPTKVYDTKCSQDPFTFPLWSETIDRGYWCQLQGYGHLYRRKKLVLAYCLVNTPEDIIERNAFYKTRAKYGPDFTQEEQSAILDEETRNNTYDDLPIQLRVKLYEFDADPVFIQQVIERVKLCRKYIATLEQQLIAKGKHPLYFENLTTSLNGEQKQVA